jgi:hypothetical protein
MTREEGVSIAQIKEKFGGLRFYVDGGSDKLHAAIEAAERKSLTICEKCGNPGEPAGLDWIKTLCTKCRKERNAR